MSKILILIAGWLFLGLIVATPWALAGQPPWAGAALVAGVAVAVLFRLAGGIGQPPRVPLVALVLSVGLILLGWLALSRANSVAIENRTPPADVVATIRSEALFLTAMLLAGLLAIDLGHDPRWRRRASQSLVCTAAAIAVVGTVGHLGLANPYARFMSSQEGEAPFGPFNYQANAGAFLNLALPLAVLGCGVGVVPAIASAAIAVGIAINASKAAQGVAVIEAIACVVVWWRGVRRDRPARARLSACPRPLVVALVLAGIVAAALGSRQAVHRWSKIANAIRPDSSRPTLWRVCWHMAESAGWRGDGPGTFKLIFPHSPHMDPALFGRFIVKEYRPGTQVSMWNHVHDDYLQTLIEWGWPGTALWLALFGGGLLAALGRSDRSSAPIVIALAGVLLHALIDFPLQVEVLRLDVALLLALAWSRPAQ